MVAVLDSNYTDLSQVNLKMSCDGRAVKASVLSQINRWSNPRKFEPCSQQFVVFLLFASFSHLQCNQTRQ